MARATYVLRDGCLVPKGGAFDRRPSLPRSHLPAPMIISDHLPDLQSQLNGQVFDSKSSLRRHYKENGVVELGNDAPTEPTAPPRPEVTKREVAVALDKVKQGYRPTVPNEPAEIEF
jgi:hypothetical protein